VGVGVISRRGVSSRAGAGTLSHGSSRGGMAVEVDLISRGVSRVGVDKNSLPSDCETCFPFLERA